MGIGTANPGQKLTVAGNIQTSGNRLYASNIGANDYYWVLVNSTTDGAANVLGVYSDGTSDANNKVSLKGMTWYLHFCANILP
ncbi:MAG: hypothetical protein KatS3mg099_128 [Candidatus Parcubacteria bacterium]|nr:MAG: hypothetical protein KatS3mg099_128 [Candidatus Parcubacteria bacterium]